MLLHFLASVLTLAGPTAGAPPSRILLARAEEWFDKEKPTLEEAVQFFGHELRKVQREDGWDELERQMDDYLDHHDVGRLRVDRDAESVEDQI